MSVAGERPIVLYDRDCGFCRWSLAKLLAWDRRGRLRPVALQDAEAERLLASIPEQERMASWHLVEPGGAVSSAGRAFAPLFRILPGGSPFATAVERAPGLTSRAYRWVAEHRDVFGPRLSEGSKRRADRRIAARR